MNMMCTERDLVYIFTSELAWRITSVGCAFLIEVLPALK